MSTGWMDETICGHWGEEQPAPCHAVVPPLYLNSLHTFDTIEDCMNFNADEDNGQYTYGRVSNPTVALLEQKLNALERGAGALCFGSGMAAITSTVMHCVKPGGHIVAVRNCYGPAAHFFTQQLRDKFGIDVTFVEGSDVSEFERAARKNTQLFYLESPSSLVFSLQDLKKVAQLAKSLGVKTAIDNTWSTPIFQKPITMGIDFVIHTLSKYVGGHSDIIGGAVICASHDDYLSIRKVERELFGGILGPFEGWLAIRGLRSLNARMAAHQANAMEIARRLAEHKKVKTLYYPGHPSHPQYALAKEQMSGFSGLMSIVPDMSFERTCAFVNKLELFRRGCSWGGFESLVIVPMHGMSEEQARAAGGARNLVRLHVGQENVEDLWRELDSALNEA